MASTHTRTVTTLCVGLLFIVLSTVTQAHAAPKLTVENPANEFKAVWEGEILEHTFVLKNDGDEELEVRDVRTS